MIPLSIAPLKSNEMLKILIIEVDPLICLGIEALLNKTFSEKTQIMFAGSRQAFDLLIEESEPDLAILGLYKVPIVDIAYIKDRISLTHPDTPFIICYDESPKEAMQSFSKQGILGFISKYRVHQELCNCIEAVSKGKTYLCAETIQKTIKGWTQSYKKTAGAKAIIGPGKNGV